MLPSLLDRAAARLRRLRFGQPVIVVSGLPRSGTSVVMQMLQAGGATILTDHVRAADDDNPRGYLEYEPVKHLATATDTHWLRKARGQAVKVISYLLPYLPDDNCYDVIFVERDLREVVASQDRMLARRGSAAASEPRATRRLLEEHLALARRQLRGNRTRRVLPLPYRTVIETPREGAERIRHFLGVPLDVDAMAAAVDTSLYRNRMASR